MSLVPTLRGERMTIEHTPEDIVRFRREMATLGPVRCRYCRQVIRYNEALGRWTHVAGVFIGKCTTPTPRKVVR